MSTLSDIPFDPALDAPLYRQLYTHLRTAILSGRLKHGAKLPSTRALAAELNVSRNTVLTAYEQLLAEGYLEGIEGAGTFVASSLPNPALSATKLPDGSRREIQTTSPRLSARAETLIETPKMP